MATNSDPKTPPTPGNAPRRQDSPPPEERESILTRAWNTIVAFFDNIFSLILSIVRMFWSLLLVIPETITTLLPSVTTSDKHSKHNQQLKGKLTELVKSLKLSQEQEKLIIDHWIDQIAWSDGRAIRENDANTLIRWWQIILGVLIPVITNGPALVLGMDRNDLVSVMGIFLAVLTAIAQFRRPDERWRHYRITHEQYLMELWGFIALSEEIYRDIAQDGGAVNHQNAFSRFDARMRKIRQEDVDKFFGNVVGDEQSRSLERIRDISAQIEELKKLQANQPGS